MITIKQSEILINHLKEILTPLLYSGYKDLFTRIQNKSSKETLKHNFNEILLSIPSISKRNIEIETSTIKEKSQIPYFDKLLKGIIKTKIKILSKKEIDKDILKNIKTEDFILKCYTKSSKMLLDNANLFINDKKEKIYEILKTCIDESILDTIPMDDLLDKYLEKTEEPEDILNEMSLEKTTQSLDTKDILKISTKPVEEPLVKVISAKPVESLKVPHEESNKMESLIKSHSVSYHDKFGPLS